MPSDASHLEPNEREEGSREVATLIKYILGTGEFEGWYDPEMVKPYLEAADEVYGNTELLDEMTVFMCKLMHHMNPKLQDRIVYDGRNKMARRLAEWWETHQDVDEVREANFEASPELQFLDDHIDLNRDNALAIREFIEKFIDVMENEDHPMSYLEGLENTIEVCRIKERKNGK